MLKKLSILLSASLIAVLLVACGGSSVLGDYLDEHRDELIGAISGIGDATIEEGRGNNEIVVTFRVSDGEYEAMSEFGEVMGMEVEEVFEMFLEDTSTVFVAMANGAREETELDEVTVRVVFEHDGNELASESFPSQ